MDTKKRLLWPDLIRVVAIFLVVVLHASASYVPLLFEQSMLSWWVANLIDSLSRMCVPLFIMLSGALLVAKEDSIQSFYRKRGARLLKPWFFWSLIYGGLNLFQGDETGSVMRLVMGTVWTGFWILPVLLGLYVVTPLFKHLIKSFGKRFLFGYLLAMGAFLVTGFHFPVYFEYSFYFVVGYLLSRIELSKRELVFIGWGGLLSWLLIADLTYYLSFTNQVFVDTYYNYHAWTVVLLSIFGFVILKGLGDNCGKFFTKKRTKLLVSLSENSFGIYFIHMLVFRSGINLIHFPSYVFIPLISLVIYVVSYWLIKNFRRAPLFGQTIG